nr:hypothetical protein CFP56_24531 [Quercus suber]
MRKGFGRQGSARAGTLPPSKDYTHHGPVTCGWPVLHHLQSIHTCMLEHTRARLVPWLLARHLCDSRIIIDRDPAATGRPHTRQNVSNLCARLMHHARSLHRTLQHGCLNTSERMTGVFVRELMDVPADTSSVVQRRAGGSSAGVRLESLSATPRRYCWSHKSLRGIPILSLVRLICSPCFHLQPACVPVSRHPLCFAVFACYIASASAPASFPGHRPEYMALLDDL